MKGDFSQFHGLTNQKKQYNQVLKQQGRVQLDSDWNEFNAITAHQRRERTIDIIGKCGAPKENAGFEIIHPIGTNLNLFFTTGNFYIGGLLCQTAPCSQLPILGFINGNLAVKVEKPQIAGISLQVSDWIQIFTNEMPKGLVRQIAQISEQEQTITLNQEVNVLAGQSHPYIKKLISYSGQTSLPNAPIIEPTPTGGRSDLVYLEVWERHITAIEDPELREVALGGPDTDTRSRIITQVKVIEDVGNVTCKDVINKWNQLIAPSDGRLSTDLDEPTGADNPCQLTETGGYLGLENRLYRVEIHHNSQAAGGATFKWSRSNAAQVYTISEFIPETGNNIKEIRLQQNGKDNILSIKQGDFVEITNENSDLDTLQAGKIVEVVKVKNNNTLELSQDISAFNIGESLPKVRRWDISNHRTQAITKISDGPTFQLEDGIEITFSGTNFKSGDYWVFKARTLTRDIESGGIEKLDEAVPFGVQRHYCKLAIVNWQNDNSAIIEDCRPIFPSLTNICAEDICFDNTNCDFPPTTQNVQQALDLLCVTEDLRLHHKLLHGYGIVCGLKMKCINDTPETINIEEGYAIDCEGRFIQVKERFSYSVVEEAKPILEDRDSGTVCLSISRGDNNTSQITIETFEQKSFWEEVLQGTLIKDFYEDCVLKIISFLQERLGPFPLKDEDLVTQSQKRLTVLLNLLLQVQNSKNGRCAFISGSDKERRNCDKDDSIDQTDDELLYCFYTDLKNLIANESFCAMFDGDTPFPEYLIDEGMETIYGPALKEHRILRVHPDGKFAYTSGNDNKIYVYDLQQKTHIQTTILPDSANTVIQNIVLSTTGDTLYVLGLLNDKNTSFAQANIEDNGFIKWEIQTILAERRFVNIAVDSKNNLYAIEKGKGLFEITNEENVFQVKEQLLEANATGLLYIPTDITQAFVAVADETDEVDFDYFTRIIGVGSETQYNFRGKDADNDLLLVREKLYITGDNNRNNHRELGVFALEVSNPQQVVSIGGEGVTRLAHWNTEEKPYLLLSLAEQSKVVRMELSNENNQLELDTKFQLLAQHFPVQIATHRETNRGYILNTTLNTITTIDMAQVFHEDPAPDFTINPPYNLILYREQALKAYTDLLNHLLQYLKDCFCDKFLIDCPTCGPEDKVYLGVVEIRDGRVYKICNFTKRQYVKSFPTLEYWLSTIPLIPVVKELFNQFCCYIIDIEGESRSGISASGNTISAFRQTI